MVITADSDSANPGSLPGTAFKIIFFVRLYTIARWFSYFAFFIGGSRRYSSGMQAFFCGRRTMDK
jgi:hypothetical protein